MTLEEVVGIVHTVQPHGPITDRVDAVVFNLAALLHARYDLTNRGARTWVTTNADHVWRAVVVLELRPEDCTRGVLAALWSVRYEFSTGRNPWPGTPAWVSRARTALQRLIDEVS